MVEWGSVQQQFLGHLLDGDSERAISLAQEIVGSTATAAEFFDGCVAPCLEEVGRRFEELAIFLPEMVDAAEIVEHVNEQVINPALEAGSSTKAEPLGRVLLATVQGDLHDIGKSMVALMLRVGGFEVVDLGIDVAPATIVEQAVRNRADIIALSTLLTTCLPYIKDVVDSLRGQGVRGEYAVIIGGAAPTPEFAEQVGVDAYGHTAAEAVTICKRIVALDARPIFSEG